MSEKKTKLRVNPPPPAATGAELSWIGALLALCLALNAWMGTPPGPERALPQATPAAVLAPTPAPTPAPALAPASAFSSQPASLAAFERPSRDREALTRERSSRDPQSTGSPRL